MENSKRNTCPDCSGSLKEHKGKFLCVHCESMFTSHKEVLNCHKFHTVSESSLREMVEA